MNNFYGQIFIDSWESKGCILQLMCYVLPPYNECDKKKLRIPPKVEWGILPAWGQGPEQVRDTMFQVPSNTSCNYTMNLQLAALGLKSMTLGS